MKTEPTARATKARWSMVSIVIVVLGVAGQLALLRHSIRANSAAFDEGMHIAAGYRYWECGDFGINPEHPPLVKLLAAFPVRHWPIGAFGRPCGQQPVTNEELLGDGYRLINGPHGDEALLAAREAVLVIPLALVVAAFAATRLWFGPTAAMLAVVFVVFEPNLSGHGQLVTTDAAIALATLLAAMSAWLLAERPTVPRVLALGLALGLALASKHSGVLVPPLVGVELGYLALARRATTPRIARLAVGWLLACGVAVAFLWATYGFRYAAMPPGAARGIDLASAAAAGGPGDVLGRAVSTLARRHLLPESYLAGLLYVRDHAAREAYFFGRELKTGVWDYFPVALTIKTTVPMLVLVLAGLLARPARWREEQPRAVVVLPVAAFLGAAMLSRMNIGIRHVLPVYPFFVVLAAATAAEWSRRSRLRALVVALLVLWHVGSYLGSYPGEISYANEAWGGPRRLHRYLGDSNADWGQSLYRVRDYVARHDVGDCWIAWFGMRKPSEAGIPCRELPGPMFLEIAEPTLPAPVSPRFAGTVFVSATLTEHAIYPYTSFAQVRPVDVVDGSVLVFRGDFDLPAVEAARRGSRGWWLLNRGRLDEARAELLLSCRTGRSPIVDALLKAVSPGGCVTPSLGPGARSGARSPLGG